MKNLTINRTIIKLINQPTTQIYDYIYFTTPYIQSKKLIPEQQEALLHYLKHLLVEKHVDISPRYLKQSFRILRDFGASIKRPYSEVDVDDFKIYYQSVMDNNGISNSTLDTYESTLKKFCGYVFEKDKRLGEWNQLAFKVKMIFNSDKIKENTKLDYKQAMINKKTRGILRYLKSRKLTEEQKQTLKEYHRYLTSGSSKRVSVHCLHGNFRTLHQFGAFIKKPFNEVERKDFTDYFYELNQVKKVSPVTLDAYKHIIKKFYKFLHYGDIDPKQNYPKIVRHIKLDKIEIKKSRAEMLTREEVAKVIENCTNVRDRLMVSLHYEAITRPEELFSIKIGDIRSDDYGFEIDIIRIKQKNKQNNKLPFRIIESEPYLREWLNLHPLRNDQEAYLFISLKQTGKYVLYAGLSKVVKKASKSAGITKRVYPYIFRHSRITHLKQEGWSDDEIKQITGHSDSSKMLSNYSHLVPNDVNEKRMKQAGKLTEKEDEQFKKEKESLKPKICPRCEKTNTPTAKYCNCGMALDLKTVMQDTERREKADQRLNEFFSDPEFKDMFKKFLEKKMAR